MKPWTYKGEVVKELPPGMIGFLYLIITPENRYYIGQCVNKRWRYYPGGGKDLRKYHAENGHEETRKIVIMFFDNEVELDKAEQHLTLLVDAKNNPKYYNRMDGGKFNSKVGKETREAQSKAHSGKNNSFYGKKHSEESKQRMRQAKLGKTPWNKGVKGAQVSWLKGKKHSEESKQRMRQAQAGKKLSEETKWKISQSNLGKVTSEETKRKLSEIKKGVKLGPMSPEAYANLLNRDYKGENVYNSIVSNKQAELILMVAKGPDKKYGYVKKMSDISGISYDVVSNIAGRRSYLHIPIPEKSITLEEFKKHF